MPDTSTFAIFVAAALALLLVPGPAVIYVVARSVEGGRLTGLVSVLGVELGTLLATLGLFTDGLYALLGGTAGEWIRKQRAGAGLPRARRFVTGGVYIALGAVAAISGKD